MYTLKAAYQATYHKHMEKVVEDELSFKTKRMFVMAMQGGREDDNVPVSQARVDQDVRDLYAAGAAQLGTDEIKVCGILLSRSQPHLAALAQAYQRAHKKTLAQMVDAEFSGHMRDGLRFVVDGAMGDGNGIERDAALIEESMKGFGTKDERLVYR